MARERNMAEISDTCDKACKILEKTKDGDLLDPQDLKLTESAVNGCLSEAGYEVFERLYQNVVVDGTYNKPYLHGIEHITRDHEGYIYYKGSNVEHYDRDYVNSEDAKNSLLELKRRCEFLERKGVEVTSASVIWGWANHAAEYAAERLIELDAALGEGAKGLFYSHVEVYCLGRTHEYFLCGRPMNLDEVMEHPVTQSLIRQNYDDEYEVKISPFVYDKNAAQELIPSYEISNTAEIEDLLHSVHAYLKDEGKLAVLQEYTQKTDFAEGYEKTKLLDSLIGHPGRSLQYSEVFMYGNGGDQRKLYICGTPTFDEVKAYYKYRLMAEIY